ncbi:19756_t:CDS:2 [Entrophospora sp. SA101]|nr:19756_t:CDS:2 [Entrophospora sp. SA101]
MTSLVYNLGLKNDFMEIERWELASPDRETAQQTLQNIKDIVWIVGASGIRSAIHIWSTKTFNLPKIPRLYLEMICNLNDIEENSGSLKSALSLFFEDDSFSILNNQ